MSKEKSLEDLILALQDSQESEERITFVKEYNWTDPEAELGHSVSISIKWGSL